MMFFDLKRDNIPHMSLHLGIEEMLLRIKARVEQCPYTPEESKKNTLECIKEELEELSKTQGATAPKSSV